jgi:hypothetical protein
MRVFVVPIKNQNYIKTQRIKSLKHTIAKLEQMQLLMVKIIPAS